MQKSKHHLYIEVLAKRILPDDIEASAIQQEFHRLEAGFAGEMKLKQTLSDYYFKTDHHIFYNFECMNDNGFSHQMDAVLVTSYFIVIFEVKLLSGVLFYKPAQHEFYRIHNEKRENFRNPFDQVYRHQLFLEQCLRKWQITIPVYFAVVIANQQAILDESLEKFPIFHISGVPNFIENLYRNTAKFSANISMIVAKLNQLYQTLPPRRSISLDRLRKGVLCRQCNYKNVMDYHYGTFTCNVCRAKSRDVLFETLYHYRILIGEKISNRQFRDFFGMTNIRTCSNILSRLGFEKCGSKRGTYYIIPENILSWSKKKT
ncbi:nuclease-related domain-containing protein [Solibacillus isronensis]|uniref:nuclease-related domain-containing protein n=1 Tax=Solibacillus isronensis TaxID=412383 RepID=UPI0009A5823B|nr:nuclease-related domain-containing protein [Solibacillus isronensis]